jgi:mannitol-1-/sugar-/sorbitol-6-phosphatase
VASGSFYATAIIFDLDGTLIDSSGAFKLLNSLPADAWAVITKDERHVAEAKMTKASLPIPKVMITKENDVQDKPSPEAFLAAAQKLRARVQDTIVIENSIAGIEAAKRAEMRCIALRTNAPDALLEDATEIIDDLTSLSAAIYMRGLLLHLR